MIHNSLKKTTLLYTPPLIVVAISFCVAGIALFAYFYYSDYQDLQLAKDEGYSTKLIAQKTDFSYKESSNLIKAPTHLPLEIKVMGEDISQKSYVVSYSEIFHASWIPLLVIGSYILVHARNGIESKADI